MHTSAAAAAGYLWHRNTVGVKGAIASIYSSLIGRRACDPPPLPSPGWFPVQLTGIWLWARVRIRRAVICDAALRRGNARESPFLRRDLLPRLGSDDLSHRTGSNGWEWSAGKTLSFVSVAAGELEETLMQGDGPGRGYNYVSALFCSLAECGRHIRI